MEALNSWVKGIVCYSILTAVFMEVLPEKFRKYIRLYLGLLFVLLFLSPVIRLFHLEDRMEDFFNRENLKIELEDKSFELQLKEEAALEELKEEYTRQLGEELSGFLSGQGYKLSEVELAWEEDTGKQDFGSVSSLTLVVRPLYDAEPEGIRVERVKIEVFQKQEESMEERALKNELASFYNIDSSNINVSIQGGEGA
ncbi:MAG: stage III sporulation protein AF [Lachnospiraceae bacterium]|nr:stage III sporulation protein AF [Lachnospiraceae bacterium]